MKGNGTDALADAFASAEQRKSFFFEPASRLQLLEKLEHLSRFSDFLLLVSGPSGAGKTVLLQQLKALESDRTLRLCSIDAVETPGLNALLVSLSEQLSPEIDTQADNQQILNAIYDFVRVMAAEHLQWSIIIDNADQLEKPALQLLLQMLSDAQGLALKPHVLMAAGEGFGAKLQAFEEYAVLEAQVHNHELEAFTLSEAKKYLLQRYSASASLSEKQLQAVYEASKGYPGGLNEQAEQLFRSGSVSKASQSAGLTRTQLVSVASVLLLVLFGALWQYWPENDNTSDRTQVAIQLPVEKEVVAAEVSEPVQEVGVIKPTVTVPGATASVKSDVVVKPDPVKEAAAPSEIVVIETPGPEVEKDAIAEVKRVEIPALSRPAAEKVVPVVEDQPVSKPVIAPAPVVSPKPAPKPLISAVESSLSESEEVLMSWPASGYTLQMLGAGVKKSAEKFINAQAEPQKFYLFQTRYKNKPWFVVVYGQYKDRAMAQAASKSLPVTLAKLKPWARTIQGIQTDLSTRK
ncbi:SPOR domain-containing protein [Amphritea japonica]|nr:AAA family ATPase [Amphritea japonica]